MNRIVADPEWHSLIVWYFFLGGIAAGSYAIASMASLFGNELDRRGTRAAFYMAFPLVNVCGILLIVDLGRPERFWHMMIQSRTAWPMLKWWSPISAGAWGLALFGLFSAASFLGVLAEDGRCGLARWRGLAHRLGQGIVGRIFEIGGTLSAFFLGAYTGTLLTATNQPIWADTTWLSALFLACSASTGVAAILLANRWWLRETHQDVDHRLERVDLWAIGIELLTLLAFAVSLGGLIPEAFGRWPGALIPGLVLPAGILFPIGLAVWKPRRSELWAATLVLLAGFALRFAIVGMPIPLLGATP